ncbi:MAG: hypothetical protein D6780_04765 [Candidatus Dadabacteria bacterium]|nr:MAG: hypothetical protein D6780_04765 [Candidatus Dadabacteria bacterium]
MPLLPLSLFSSALALLYISIICHLLLPLSGGGVGIMGLMIFFSDFGARVFGFSGDRYSGKPDRRKAGIWLVGSR